MNIVPVERHEAKEVTDVGSFSGWGNVDNGLDFCGVRCAPAFGDDVTETLDAMVVEVALLKGEAEACDPSAVVYDLVCDEVICDVLRVDKDVILVLVDVWHCVAEVVEDDSCEHDCAILASLGITNHSRSMFCVSNAVLCRSHSARGTAQKAS